MQDAHARAVRAESRTYSVTLTGYGPDRVVSLAHLGREIVQPFHDGRRHGDLVYRLTSPDRAELVDVRMRPWLEKGSAPAATCCRCGATSDSTPAEHMRTDAVFYPDGCPQCDVVTP